MKKVLYGRYSKGTAKTITTTPPVLAVNTYPANANSFELHGKSLSLNQQIYQIYNTIDPSLTGLTVTFNNGLLSVSGTADVTLNIKFLDNDDLVANHKYYLNAPTGSSTSGYRPYFSTSGDSYITDSIITWTTGKGSFNIRVNGGTSTGFSYYPQFIDLTQMFGPGLEPTTVDQLKAIIDIDKYIPFNPGTFIHNNATYEVNKGNQLMQPTGYLSRTSTGITYVNNNDGTVTMSGTATGTDHITYLNISSYWIVGHKYLIGTSSKYSNKLSGNSISQDFTGAALFTYSSAAVFLGINVTSGVSYSDTWSVNFIDLTDIFGTGKEPSTIDECKLRFLAMGIDVTKYQPYSPLGGQYCGYRNIWDEEWEVGGIHSSDGEKYDASDRIRSKNIIPCLPNTSYYFQKPSGTNKYGFVYFYDANKVYISYTDYNTTGSYAFETPSNAHYMNFVVLTTTTYNKNDISIYQVSNKVDLGFNIWDEEWKVGHIVAGIETDDGTYRLISKNYIPVLPNTTYFLHCGISCGATIYTYDANKNYLQYISDSDATNVLFTTLSNSVYIKLQMYGAYGQTSTLTYNHDICINLSQPDTTKSPHNGDYMPYLMLRGIGSDFNVWDEQWELGTINATTGELTDSTTMIRSKNKLPVLPSTSYYFQIPSASSTVVAIHAYDTNGTWIGMYQPGGGWITSGGAYNLTTQTFTTPSSAAFLRFRLGTSYGTNYKNDICINLSQPQTTINPHNGQYVPHLFDTYDSISGILTRRIGVVDLGVQTWSGGTNGKWRTTITPANKWIANNTKIHAFAEKYEIATANDIYYSVVTVPSIGGEDSDGHLYCYTGSSSVQPSGMFLYELVAYQVFTPIQYSVVDLGSLSWGYTGSNRYRALIPDDMKVIAENVMPNWRCSSKTPCSATTNLSSFQNGICLYNPGNANYLYTYASSSSAATPTGILTYQNNTPYKFGVVDMGSLNWTRVDVTGSGGYVFSTPATPLQMYKQSDNLWCSGYTTGHYSGTGSTIYNYGNKIIAQHTPSGEFNIYVRDDSYTSASAFTNAVKGKILTYELSDSISQTTITQPISFVAGKLGKQYGVVDLGSLSWIINNAHTAFFVGGRTLWGSSSLDIYTANYIASSTDTTPGHMVIANGNLIIYEDRFDNAITFKNAMQGQYLIYRLADGATGMTYATAGNLIRKTNGDVGDVDFNLTYNTLLNENKFLISYNMGTSQSPDKRLINVGGILNA